VYTGAVRGRRGCGRAGGFTESIVEGANLVWFEALDYSVLHGPGIAADEPGAQRSDANYRDVLLDLRLRLTRPRITLAFSRRRFLHSAGHGHYLPACPRPPSATRD